MQCSRKSVAKVIEQLGVGVEDSSPKIKRSRAMCAQSMDSMLNGSDLFEGLVTAISSLSSSGQCSYNVVLDVESGFGLSLAPPRTVNSPAQRVTIARIGLQ